MMEEWLIRTLKLIALAVVIQVMMEEGLIRTLKLIALAVVIQVMMEGTQKIKNKIYTTF
jgi:hypothetical protein